MPDVDKPEELVQQMAATPSWGVGGDFVFDPITGKRSLAEMTTAEAIDSNVKNKATDKPAAGNSETVAGGETPSIVKQTKKD